jgi:hypothetical protein
VLELALTITTVSHFAPSQLDLNQTVYRPSKRLTPTTHIYGQSPTRQDVR